MPKKTAHTAPARLAGAVAIAFGSIALTGGAAAAITYRAADKVNGTWAPANTKHTETRHVHSDDVAPCPQVHSACSTAVALTAHSTAGGRITYR